VVFKSLFFNSNDFLEHINFSDNPIFFCCGFIAKSKEPVGVCCESLKERVVWLVIQFWYDILSDFVFVTAELNIVGRI
jgi:hypothetical protein